MPVDPNIPFTGTAALIADAAIRVMVNQGLDALSVRNVAAEAGVAPGTVQYQMGTRDDIIAKAFMRSIQRQESRALRETDATDFHAVIRSRLAELLPIGPVQREDAAVWVIVGDSAVAGRPRCGTRADRGAFPVSGLERQEGHAPPATAIGKAPPTRAQLAR